MIGATTWNFLQRKANNSTVCLFTEPDPALRERFDGSAECTQEGHSLYGKTPDAETTISYNRLRKEYRHALMLFTSAIRLSLDDSTKQASNMQCSSETDFNALLQWVEKSYGRNNASSAPSYLDQCSTPLLWLPAKQSINLLVGC